MSNIERSPDTEPVSETNSVSATNPVSGIRVEPRSDSISAPVKTLSVRNLNWTDRCTDEGFIRALEQEAGLDVLTARLLAGRGILPSTAQKFLAPKLRDYLPNPYTLKDMDKASVEILNAVQAQKKITIFADYDVDGGTSAAQLIRWGRAIGAEFELYVPDRVKEGYGPSVAAFEALKASGTDLVITVDCGAAAHIPLKVAYEIDLPVIVLDHHLMEADMPPALAIVNPNRLDDESGLGHLAAAGVTFMTLIALNREAKKRKLDNTPNLLEYLGLAALGTVCDVVNLTGVNRAIVGQGLKVLSQRAHVGIEALADIANAEGALTTYHAGFVLGPRINAGGRIGRADMGAELLSTENAQLAYAHAAELNRVNEDRKKIQDQILEEALVEAYKYSDDPVLVVAMEGWHSGVIGIIAGRLKERFNKPAIVIGLETLLDNTEDGRGLGDSLGIDSHLGLGKGSGRSIQGVNLGGAIVAAKEAGLLLGGGGHAMAGGLSVVPEKIDALREFLCTYLKADVERACAQLSLSIDAWLSPTAITVDILEKIERVGPYGAGNPQPIFAFSNMRVCYAERLRGGHIRCAFENANGERVKGICFRADEAGLSDVLLSPDAPLLDIAGRLKENNWKGRKQVDFQLQDVRRVR